MHFYLGDTPGVVTLVPASVSDLSGLASAVVGLAAPDGTSQALAGATLTDNGVTVALPAMDQAGVWLLGVTLTGSGRSVTLEPVRIPIEFADGLGWYTLDAARRDWPGAPEDDARLHDLLAVARTQVLEYAPELELAPVPAHYRAAQLLQARNVWNATQTDPNSSQMNGDGFAVPVYPLDWSVRQMLRPQRVVPVVA
ncbi:hypothetical protein LG314_07940 [Agrococcus terreus]|uniref:hypothetical protein n=1 Tax=Agrococcus terreus TaxID=574649 RepID=UPI00384AE058